MKKGVVKEYDLAKGFGFITSQDNEDCCGLREYLKNRGLCTGQRVSFDVDFGIKGDKAINVKLD